MDNDENFWIEKKIEIVNILKSFFSLSKLKAKNINFEEIRISDRQQLQILKKENGFNSWKSREQIISRRLCL